MFLTTLKYTQIEIRFNASGQESNAIEHVSRNGLFSPSRDSVILTKQFLSQEQFDHLHNSVALCLMIPKGHF